MKALIITEKPSVAASYANTLNVKTKNDGYYENDEYIITWAIGHLVTLAYPEEYDEKYKKWVMEDLPFLPEQYKYKIIKEVKKQFNTIKELIHRKDVFEVLYAGDSGREGIYIQALIRQEAKVPASVNERVVWIDSQTDAEIRKGVKEAKPIKEYFNLINSGYARAIEDYSTGINFSRLLSIRYGQIANLAAETKTHTAIAVGRVMSFVLGLVVEREREIENFVPTPFYRVSNILENDDSFIMADWKAVETSKYFNSPLLYNETGFKTKEDAENFVKTLGTKTVIESIKKTKQTKKAPFLFNLAELQAECSSKFKISPDDTLAITQALYEKHKMVTYPRTDARVLSTAVAIEIHKNLRGLSKIDGFKEFADHIIDNNWYKGIVDTQYVDDSKVTDHYAIIPTGIGADAYENLTGIEKAVFDTIAKRFLSVFYPSAKYTKVDVVENVNGEKFFATGKILEEPGFLEVMGVTENEDDSKTEKIAKKIATLEEGNTYSCEFEVKEGKTTPPKRYTSGSMILTMENAGKFIEEEELRALIKTCGIGTPATRAETLKKLIKQQYLSLNKKTQVLTPAPLGNIVYEIINTTLPALLNAKMTASWEKGLNGIAEGEVDAIDYKIKLEDYVRKESEKIINNDLSKEIIEKIKPFAKNKDLKEGRMPTQKELKVPCPICGGKLTIKKFGCVCESYKKDADLSSGECNFAIGEIAKVILKEEEFEKLISSGEIDTRSGFKSKSGKSFSAGLKLTIEKDEKGIVTQKKIEFIFPEREEPKETSLECPKCKKKLLKNEWNLSCECGYKISHTIAGKKLSDKEMEELLTNGRTKNIVKGLVSKNKKKFDAFITAKEDGTIGFEFPEEETSVSTLNCPHCSAKLIKGSFNYSCECGYKINHTIASKKLSEDEVRQLVDAGQTCLIQGFKSKAGKSFSAKLLADDDGKLSFEFPNNK